MSKFLEADDNNDNNNDAKAIAIPLVFFENSQAKKRWEKDYRLPSKCIQISISI